MPQYLPNGPIPDGVEAVAIYARISLDDTEQGEGVARQIKTSLEYCERRGYGVYAIYCDNDLSALQQDNRPDYAALRADVHARKVRRVVIRHQSRLWRNRIERATDITAWGALRVQIEPTRGAALDLGTAQGRYLAGILGESDTSESEVKSERITDMVRDRAERGITHGSIAYGWRREYEYNSKGIRVGRREIPYEPEAAIVRKIHDGILSGRTLAAIAAELTEKGVPRPSGGDTPWDTTSVRAIATRPGNAGYIGWHLGQPDQELFPAQSPALVDPGEWHQLVALLDARKRGPGTKPGKRIYLLTYGTGECGRCGDQFQAINYVANRATGAKVIKYTCLNADLARIAAPVDDLVNRVMMARLARDDAAQLFLRDDAVRVEDVTPQIATRESKLLTLTEMFTQDLITRDQLAASTRELRAEIAELEAKITPIQPDMPASFVASITGAQAREGWARLDVAQRRYVMETIGLRVVITPVGRGRRTFDPRTVQFRWT